MAPTPRSRNLFKRNDLRRAVRSAQEAGLTVRRVDVSQEGTISVIVGEPAGNEAAAPSAVGNPWSEAIEQAKIENAAKSQKRAGHAANQKRTTKALRVES